MTNGNGAKPSGGRVLAILLLAYIFNFIDRQIVSILAVPIKSDLGLTDTQLGLMVGLSFALFYTGVGLPVAYLADRTNRVRIVAISLAVWSGFTALCGLAQNFWQFFLARMGVGIGEAGGVAPSYSLIADYFPPGRRARALAIFSFAIPIGSALGLFLGGWIADAIDWRAAFLIVGLAGLLAAPLVAWGLPEPVRGGLDCLEAGPRKNAPRLLAFRVIAAKPSFWLLSFGAACGSIVGYGLLFWLPSFLTRSFGLSLIEASVMFGSIVLLGGLAGTWCGGWIGDRIGVDHPGRYALVPAFAFVIAAPLYAAALFAPSPAAAFALFLLPQALSLAWLGPVTTAVQHLVPPEMRATASASFLFINNLIGLGLGLPLLGFVSDRLSASHGAESLRFSILYILGFYALSAALYALAARRLPGDWHRATV